MVPLAAPSYSSEYESEEDQLVTVTNYCTLFLYRIMAQNAAAALAAGAALAAQNAAAAIMALSPLQRVLHTIVGLAQPACVAVAADGYEEFMDFENMQWKDVEKWISNARKLTLNRGGFSISSSKEKRIQALAFWVNDLLRTGRATVEADINEAEFDVITMNEMAEEAYIYYLECKTDSDVSTPEKFAYNKWEVWEETVVNWLQTKRGVTDLPLSYIIRKVTPPARMDHSQLIIYNASLTTAVFKADSKKVANLLTPLVLDTDAFEWGGRRFTLGKGREGWLELVNHYNGSAESERRIAAARHKLSNLFYKNEMTFNFETFSTKLKATFDTMEKYGEGRSEREKVSTLLEKIRTSNQKLESAITFARSNHSTDYLAATNYLATQISFIFPAQQPTQRTNRDRGKRNVSQLKKDKFGKVKSCNGVDITDTSRWFSIDEWNKIRKNPEILRMINDCPKRKKKAEDRKRRKGEGNGGGRNTSSVNAGITQAVIAALQTAQGSDSSNSIPTQVQMPRMGRQRGVNAVNTTGNDASVAGSATSRQFSIEYDDDGRISSMGISKITTGNRHVSSNNFARTEPDIGYNSTIEIDSHADTHCFGRNFRIITTTEQVCSVTAFLDELATTDNVAIVTAATAMFDGDGAPFIAVFGQGLDFTKKMDKGLINPNQCRSFGVQCVDDPTDPTRKLGFYAEDVFLPLRMQGTNCLADSFCPSDDELNHFPWVYMCGDAEWDPSNVSYPSVSAMHQSMKEETLAVDTHFRTLSTSNAEIEDDMDMCNLHSRLVKAVNISKV
mmetsp:Transcript_15996/g.23840  ORF Transcript_15996/g.23840 Transcript_15996/m.23840 type:complete len:787 (+) Transcript_15996:5053-7413(+)